VTFTPAALATAVANDTASPATLSLNVGVNVIRIVVVAHNGVATSTYNIVVTRGSFVVPTGQFEV
jgi:hypothetical protein